MIDQLKTELAAIRQQRRVARRKRYYRSRLDRYRAEVVGLRRAGATLAEIAAWLRRRRCKVACSTISRYLARLPEVTDHA
jgi:DNA-binding transcriptional MerR regulator